MMKKNLVIVIVMVMVIMCVFALGAGALYAANRHPEAKAPSPQNQAAQLSPPELQVFSPRNLAEWRINDFVPVRAVITGDERIMAFEVWIDGQIYGTRDDLKEKSLNIVSGEWSWQPKTPGEHTILFRGVDARGATAYSPVLHVIAQEATPMTELVSPEAGQTLVEVAEVHQAGLEEVLKMNPGVDPGEPLEIEEHIFIPHDPIPITAIDLSNVGIYEIPITEMEQQDSANPIGELLGPFLYDLLVSPDPQMEQAGSLPAAPTLIKGELQGLCDVSLEFKDNSSTEDGFRIYRSAPNTTGFSKGS